MPSFLYERAVEIECLLDKTTQIAALLALSLPGDGVDDHREHNSYPTTHVILVRRKAQRGTESSCVAYSFMANN